MISEATLYSGLNVKKGFVLRLNVVIKTLFSRFRTRSKSATNEAIFVLTVIFASAIACLLLLSSTAFFDLFPLVILILVLSLALVGALNLFGFSFFSIFLVSGLVVTALVYPTLACAILLPLAIVGVLSLSLWTLANWKKVILAVFIALTTAIASLVLPFYYTKLDMRLAIAQGLVERDTLYHAAISAMIKNYLSVSTGLDGLVATPYHAGLHAVISGVSKLSGIGVLETYGLVPPLLLVPMLIWVVARTASTFAPANKLVVWPWICVLVLLAPKFVSVFGWTTSFVTSESFLFGITIFISACEILIMRTWNIRASGLLILVVVSLTMVKGPLGIVFLVLIMGRIFYRPSQKLLIMLTVITGSLLVFPIANWEASAADLGLSNSIEFLNYTRMYVLNADQQELVRGLLNSGSVSRQFYGWLIMVSSATVSLAIICAPGFIFVWSRCKKNVKNLVRDYQVGIVLALYSLTLISFGFFKMVGGNASYFWSIAPLVAIAFVAGEILGGLKSQNVFLSILPILLITCFALPQLVVQSAESKIANTPSNSADVERVLSFRELPPQVLSAEEVGMQNLPHPYPCWGTYFLYPALTEHPVKNLIDSQTCKLSNYYSFRDYVGH